jgi:hypothetical protein
VAEIAGVGPEEHGQEVDGEQNGEEHEERHGSLHRWR